MVNIMVVRTGPKRQKVVQAPWELIAAVRVDCLEETADNPQVHGQNMQISGECTPQNRGAYGTKAEDQDFYWGGVFCGKPKRCGILMMDFMDVFVEGAPMKCSMRPIMPRILNHKEYGNLIGDS